MNKCVFLDRDGTINVYIPYLSDSRDFALLEGVGDAIRKLNEKNYLVIVVTNQSGISRGYIDEDKLESIHSRMHETLSEYNAKIDAIYYCTSMPEDDDYDRKPNPGMLIKAINEYNIDPSKSFIIGDNLTDVLAGINANINSILISESDLDWKTVNLMGISGSFKLSTSVSDAVDSIILNGNKQKKI